MRNSTLKAVTASLAAVAVIISLGTFPVMARGGGGGHFSSGMATLPGGGFHSGGDGTAAFAATTTFYGGGYSACAPNPFSQLGHLPALLLVLAS
jgi:hypothetical protein